MAEPAGRPRIKHPARWRFPTPDEMTLDNGVAIQIFHRPGQYVASVGVVLTIPLTAEPSNREGVAGLCLRSLDEGTRDHPGPTFAEAMENLGASFAGGLTYSATQLHLSVPGHRLADSIPLLAEAIREPTLADPDIARQRSLRLAQIEQAMAQPTQRAATAFRETVIDRRYRAARLAAGTSAGVSAVTPFDVRQFHAEHYGPTGTSLIVAGDFPTDPLPVLVDSFGDWTNPQQLTTEHEVPGGAPRRCILIHRPGAVQADLRLGAFSIDRSDPRWADLQVASHALGGAFLSRLNRVLREERGYTYGVHLVTQPMRHGGLIAVQGSFRNEVVLSALEVAHELIDMHDRPLTADEVDQAVTYMIGVTPLRYATAAALVENTSALTSVGLSLSFVEHNLDQLTAVTPESASQAAAELIAPRDLSLVIVGDVAQLADPLTDQGWAVDVQI